MYLEKNDADIIFQSKRLKRLHSLCLVLHLYLDKIFQSHILIKLLTRESFQIRKKFNVKLPVILAPYYVSSIKHNFAIAMLVFVVFLGSSKSILHDTERTLFEQNKIFLTFSFFIFF